MFVPDGERMAIIIRQALPLSRCVMKQTWKKKKSQDRKRYVVANFYQKKFKSKILHWLGYCKNEEAKQGQNICSSGKPTSLFMILLCFIWKNVRSCWCLEGVCATNLELCLAHCTLTHQTPGDHCCFQMSSPIISSLKSHVFFLLVGSDRLLAPPFLFLQAAQFKGVSFWLVLFPKYVLLLSTYLRLKHLSATCCKVSVLSYFIPTLSQYKFLAAFWFLPSF